VLEQTESADGGNTGQHFFGFFEKTNRSTNKLKADS
jgi:hypothetical protein